MLNGAQIDMTKKKNSHSAKYITLQFFSRFLVKIVTKNIIPTDKRYLISMVAVLEVFINI